MPEGRCEAESCHRLIYDTEKMEELPDVVHCQHCHHENDIRERKAAFFASQHPDSVEAPSAPRTPPTTHSKKRKTARG